MDKVTMPVLIPIAPEQFWQQFRDIVREELSKVEKKPAAEVLYQTPGLTYKPLYKMAEVCAIFQISRPTIYDWIKHGKLKPVKIRSRVFFLWDDIDKLMRAI